MNKSKRLLNLLEQAEELRTSTDGKVPHSHPEEFDDEGNLVAVGKTNNGPAHSHEVKRDEESGEVSILPAGSSDSGDPDHTHQASGLKPPMKSVMRDLEKEQAMSGDEDEISSADA